jgi:hypothetical protein
MRIYRGLGLPCGSDTSSIFKSTTPALEYFTALDSKHKIFSLSHCLSVIRKGWMSGLIGWTIICELEFRRFLTHRTATPMVEDKHMVSMDG